MHFIHCQYVLKTEICCYVSLVSNSWSTRFVAIMECPRMYNYHVLRSTDIAGRTIETLSGIFYSSKSKRKDYNTNDWQRIFEN